jgi:hypothetical protein
MVPADGEAYRFEIGGGHWIFGGDPVLLRFIQSLTPVKSYKRISGIFFHRQKLYIPYPLQNHLGYLGKEMGDKSVDSNPDRAKRNSQDNGRLVRTEFRTYDN